MPSPDLPLGPVQKGEVYRLLTWQFEEASPCCLDSAQSRPVGIRHACRGGEASHGIEVPAYWTWWRACPAEVRLNFDPRHDLSAEALWSLDFSCLVPAKGWVHRRSIDNTRTKQCMLPCYLPVAIDSIKSHVRFGPTCMCPAEWGESPGAKRCPRCPVTVPDHHQPHLVSTML